jgi:hypothetical protein
MIDEVTKAQVLVFWVKHLDLRKTDAHEQR